MSMMMVMVITMMSMVIVSDFHEESEITFPEKSSILVFRRNSHNDECDACMTRVEF